LGNEYTTKAGQISFKRFSAIDIYYVYIFKL